MLLDPFQGIYEALGEEGFARLIGAFYRRIPGDPILGPMYPADDLPGAEARLRDFLIERCGGPPRYSERRGHPRLRARHARFQVDQAASDRWLELMDAALAEVEAEAPLPAEPARRLRVLLGQMATFLENRPRAAPPGAPPEVEGSG